MSFRKITRLTVYSVFLIATALFSAFLGHKRAGDLDDGGNISLAPDVAYAEFPTDAGCAGGSAGCSAGSDCDSGSDSGDCCE